MSDCSGFPCFSQGSVHVLPLCFSLTQFLLAFLLWHLTRQYLLFLYTVFSLLCELVRKILRDITSFRCFHSFQYWIALLKSIQEKVWQWFLHAWRNCCLILNIYRFPCSWCFGVFFLNTNSIYFWKLYGIVFWTDFMTSRL